VKGVDEMLSEQLIIISLLQSKSAVPERNDISLSLSLSLSLSMSMK
jgi:hypothetical protein